MYIIRSMYIIRFMDIIRSMYIIRSMDIIRFSTSMSEAPTIHFIRIPGLSILFPRAFSVHCTLPVLRSRPFLPFPGAILVHPEPSSARGSDQSSSRYASMEPKMVSMSPVPSTGTRRP